MKIVDGVPEGWELIKPKEVIEYYIGGGWGKDEPDHKHSQPAYVLRGTDIPSFNIGGINRDILRCHTKSNLKSRVLEDGDIVFEVSGGTESQWLGRTSFISQSALDRLDFDLICASFCKLIRPDPQKISPIFLFHFFKRLYSTSEISIFQVQSTGISNFQFEDFIHSQKVLLPPISIQQKFKEVVSAIVQEIQILGAKNEVLQKTRDLLLPRLMNGKLSLDHLMKEAEKAHL